MNFGDCLQYPSCHVQVDARVTALYDLLCSANGDVLHMDILHAFPAESHGMEAGPSMQEVNSRDA